MPDINDSSLELNTGATDQSAEVTTTSEASAAPAPTPQVEETEVAAKPKSLREVIEESYNKTQTTGETNAKKSALPATTADKPADAGTGTDVARTEPTKDVDPITGRQLEAIKAPAGMPAAMREKWTGLDRQVQQYWADREQHIQQTLSKTDTERKLASEFKDIATPYEPMLRQFGLTASEHAKELFNLSYTLNNGSPQTKAQVLYNLITHFKPDASTLQALFAGQQPQVPAAAPAPAVDVQKEVDRVLSERQAREEEARVDSAVRSFATDPANEFYADVAPLMAKIIDAELVSGSDYVEMFKEAYQLACQRSPEIKSILDSRQATQRPAPVALAPAAPAARPVPQVKPSLNGGARSSVPAKPMTARQAAEAAFEKLSKG